MDYGSDTSDPSDPKATQHICQPVPDQAKDKKDEQKKFCSAGGGRRVAQGTSIFALICLLSSFGLLAVKQKNAAMAAIIFAAIMSFVAVGEWPASAKYFDVPQRPADLPPS